MMKQHHKQECSRAGIDHSKTELIQWNPETN